MKLHQKTQGFISLRQEKRSIKTLFPASTPIKVHHLPVSSLHTIHVEEFGNPQGYPVLFLHGGPGGGVDESDHRLFDPAFYHIITVDQRGAGKSKPFAEVRENTTQDLIADLETIRTKLNIEKWLVFGGSWGSTLSLAYAEVHPQRVSGLILRGVFLGRPQEIQWWYSPEGSGRFFREEWREMADIIPAEERDNLVEAYYKRLNSPLKEVYEKAATLLSSYAAKIAKLVPSPELAAAYAHPKTALALARIFNHYCKHNMFLAENQLLNNIGAILQARIPTWIVQGRYDVVCPPNAADDLHIAMPEARMTIVEAAGHARGEPGITNALIEATEAFKSYAASP